MKASLRSVRIAPKKAQLVAKMIRGKSVPDAVSTLEHTNKKAARILERLLRSAMANTSHNVSQDPQMMVIKILTVNKAQSYHRGVPMARGRVRPMRKFLSHINLTLGFAEDGEEKNAKNAKSSSKSSQSSSSSKSSQSTSQTEKKPVQKETTKKSRPASAKATAGTASSSGKSAKETAPKTSKSSASKKSTAKKSSTSSKK